MRLSLLLLLTTLFVIAHAETDTDYSPESPPPPPPAWAPVSSPTSSFAPPPPPPTSTPSSPPPPPTPASAAVTPPPPPTPATPVFPPTPPPATWTPVKNVNAKAIRQVGQFAVRIYALKWKADLVFVNVVSCEIQPSDGGYYYHLLIAVSGTGTKSPQYDAVVWGILGTTTWELRSFNSTK